jgi:hypothetical protein
MAGPGDKGFKVVDKRRVGKPEEAGEPEGASEPLQAAKAGEQPAEAAAAPDERALGPIDFSTFVVSLASSALVHIGDAPSPETGKLERQLPQGKQVIDLLGLLHEKTRGNLTEDEARLLQALLLDLRLRYVEASKP